jgi:hypothetical protein
MLTIYGQRQRFCDGISRRAFLKIGGFAFGSLGELTLADVLRAEAAGGNGRSPHKAVINIFLAGGPPHQDMWDLKREAPSDIRGEFKPIGTKVPGIEICEVFPKIAAMMDRFAVIRSVVGSAPQHDAYQCMTGWPRAALEGMGGYPSLGSVAAKLLGPLDRAVPPAVGLAAPTRERRWSDSGSPGFLGPAYAPFKPFMEGATGTPGTQKVVGAYEQGPGLAAIQLRGMTLERLQDRKRLLQALDRTRRDLDADPEVHALDASHQAAFDVLTSSRLADALDLSKESPKLRRRYGDGQPYRFQFDGAPTVNEHLLIARRLVEAGCRCVTLSFGRWDSHSRNFDLVRDHGPKLDQCLSALVEDLEQRGMLDDVTVIAWGEFGRTPLINKNAGRDHWPQVSCAILAGGSMRTGQVIGSTTRLGEYADERPVHVQEIFATLYHNLGIDPETTTVADRSGRPQYLLEHRQVIPELVS